MRKPVLHAAFIMLIIATLLLTGCKQADQEEASANVYSNDVNGEVSLSEKDGFFSPAVIQNLQQYLQQGVTVREGLKRSGIVGFSDNGSVLTISQVSLDPLFEWAFEINGQKLGKDNLDTVLQDHDEISINIQYADHKKDGKDAKAPEFTVLKLDGGSMKPDMTHSYVFPYTNNQSVRDVMAHSGFVKLTDNKMYVDTVQGYSPKSVEKWVVKVNGKELVDSGLEMKLTPQDEVEIRLERASA